MECAIGVIKIKMKNNMLIQEAKDKIKKAGGSWKVFMDWMRGQTVGINKDGTTDFYYYDINRFIRYKCDPKNELLAEWD